MEVVCGLDVGTSRAKAIAVDRQGRVIARAESQFAKPPYQPQPGLAEQDADEWWQASRNCLHQLTRRLKRERIEALAIDSTSGTFVPIDTDGRPLMPALMYNDGRASGLETQVNAAASDFTLRYGYTFPPAFALVKLYWLQRHRPEIVSATHRFLHAADFLVGKLTGNFDCTDTSNALKSGADPLSGDWPPFIEDGLGLPLSKLPRVYRPGDRVGEVSAEAAAVTGVRAGTPVVAGASDGTASFLASGAKAVGDWNLTIGTTVVIRGVADQLIRDPLGRLYCHRHPDGYWLPGGASNAGGEALVKTFGAASIPELDQAAHQHLPSSLVVYPLARKGERMPFVHAEAEGFTLGQPASEVERFAGYIEGLALVTAWSVQEAGALGAPLHGEYFLCGGGAHGKTLGRVLASAVERTLVVPAEPEAAMGSALLAAAWAWHSGSVSAAQAAMVQRAEAIEPVAALVEPLKQKLEALKNECRRRKYL